MLSLVIFSVIAALVAGLAVKFFLQRRGEDEQITWAEFGIGAALIVCILAPLVTWIGWGIAKDNTVSFNQYLNGWETQAVASPITCERDGSCRYCYDCDPYQCSYECGEYEGEGNDRHYVSKTCWKTCYHSCPYVTVETNYSVATTVGSYTIDEHRFPENPNGHRWRQSESIPQSVVDNAGVGPSVFWANAKKRLDAGLPGPATVRAAYENFVLASDRTILKQYSGSVEKFSKAGLLPPVVHTIQAYYYADRVSFVGFKPKNGAAWHNALSYLNGALGSELEGDLHIVITQHPTIERNPDEYVLALKAYWQDASVFQKNAISKNSIVVVVGTEDGATVSWARAFTGMPLGNELMLTTIQNRLKRVSLTPEAVIGTVHRETRPAVKTVFGNGTLERVLWGLDDRATRFARISMTGKNPNDIGGGFLYLAHDIVIPTGSKITIVFATFFVCMGVWVAAALYGPTGHRRWRVNRY